ncbi:uncharacterized protein LOC129877521 [Solanum dulcamara]|uniref:uncharacterized protein LOC129877521 n=1 Tax=Solanum dulcamara TaxID=45834 RepID=UPI0024867D35|nr:uncharacterized protein LOC129877521 [Solanum dulcamara]
MSSHRSFHNNTHYHSSPNYYNGNHQQGGYNPRNAPRHPNYQSFIRHHYVYDNPHPDDSLIAVHEYIAQQFRNRYQTLFFQPPLPYYPVLPSVVVQGPYYPSPYYEQIDDVYVVAHPTETIWIRQLMDWQIRNSRFNFHALYNHDHEEKEDDDDDVLKYLKIRTHHAPAKDGIDPEVVVVADVESDICAICQSEYEHEESIGALQCGHEYHTDCIKQWLLKKKDCPMCRASVLPSQEQRL